MGLYEVPKYWWTWLGVQLVVVTIDLSFMLLRPHTLPGGNKILGFIFSGWQKVCDRVVHSLFSRVEARVYRVLVGACVVFAPFSFLLASSHCSVCVRLMP